MSVTAEIWMLHTVPPIQNREKMDTLEVAIHQLFYDNPLYESLWGD